MNHCVGLRTKGRVFEACVRSALLYGADTWAMTRRLMDVLCRCDRKMLRYVAGVGGKMGDLAVRWQRCVELKTFLLRHGRED